MKVFREISRLLDYAKQKLFLRDEDVNYVRNSILDILSLDSFEESDATSNGCTVDELLSDFVSACVDDGIFAQDESAYSCDKVMGALSLSPSALTDKFNQTFSEHGSKAATDFLYGYCVANTYVKKSVLDKNPRFSRDGLIVTINLAKPEFRDPNKAKAGNSVQGGYPKCVICRENEGLSHRGKSTLRTVPITLCGSDWFWQFSPYGYFYQHGIAVNTRHIPMHVDKQTFYNLVYFVDKFPHYFIGCNAPLERIGGSVLAHDHYQGGGEKLPLHSAGLKRVFEDREHPDVTIGIVDWAGTVVRIAGYNKNSVVEVSEKIRQAWKNYTNKSLGIVCGENGVQFNEISPTVYKRNGSYEMNVILRSNITSAQYPDGVFHAHPEFHAIKKESIGLIEAQGLFILPGRLVSELDELENLIVKEQPLPDDMAQFKLVYDEVNSATADRTKAGVHSAMEGELASVCRRILQNTAVFKNDGDFAAFLEGCGFADAEYQYKITAAGRINIIGEHVDYCGGKVLPAALKLNNTVFVRKNGTNKIHIRWTTLPDSVTIDLDDVANADVNRHAGFQLGCIAALQRTGRKLVGCDMLYDCGVPFGSGLSSSAAIEVSTLYALAAAAGFELDKREAALLAQQAEREFSGVNCGIMDQYASANGRKNCAMLLDCSTVTHEYVPIALGDYCFVVANTNKPHSLADSKYNERREQTEQALKVFQKQLKVDCLAQVTPADFDKYKSELNGVLYNRAKHVVTECDRVNKAVDAMEKGNLQALGALLNQSHCSLRDDYEVSCRELDVLQELSVNQQGCLGARMIGGGFGGCVLALVSKGDVETFKRVVGEAYKQAVGYEASFYDAEIENGVTIKNIKEA